jgi:hypothetical protein
VTEIEDVVGDEEYGEVRAEESICAEIWGSNRKSSFGQDILETLKSDVVFDIFS